MRRHSFGKCSWCSPYLLQVINPSFPPLQKNLSKLCVYSMAWSLSGGSAIKNPPANSGDAGDEISSSRGSSWPRDQTPISCDSCIGGQIVYRLSEVGCQENALRTQIVSFIRILLQLQTLSFWKPLLSLFDWEHGLKELPCFQENHCWGESATFIWHPRAQKGPLKFWGKWEEPDSVSRRPGSPATALMAAPSPGLWGVLLPNLGRDCWDQHMGRRWGPETQDTGQWPDSLRNVDSLFPRTQSHMGWGWGVGQ